MRFLSVCSGIEAASVAWEPLGWKALAFAEIEKFPRAVLAHHYPSVPLYGDFTKLRDHEFIVDADVLVGGTPCQAFSIAGLRQSLNDDRGNLSLEFVRLANAIDDLRRAAGKRDAWICWENVPGVLSVADNAFGAFLGGLVGSESPIVPDGGWTNAGVVAGPRRTAAWRVLDAQFFGVAQRRRRVFVLAVGHSRGWACAEALLSIAHSLQGHPAPRREAGQGTAGGLEVGLNFSGQSLSAGSNSGVAPTLDTGAEHHNRGIHIAHSLRGEGFDAGEDGTGRGTPLIAIQERAVSENPDAGPDGAGFRTDGMAYTLEARTVPQAIAFNLRGREDGAQPEADPDNLAAMRAASGGSSRSYIAFSAKDHGADAMEDCSPTLRAGGHSGSHANAGVMPAVAFMENVRAELRISEATDALTRGGGKPGQGYPATLTDSAVRRLTPRECERLQGFPDDYTNIPWRGKALCPDGPRYKALGNSMAVPCMAWLGERIAAVEAFALEHKRAA